MTPSRVIGTYYLVSGLYILAAAMIWGVNTLFLLNAGLDILAVFLANAAFTAGSVVFEIPTGVLADTAGRRASFLLSVAILFLTTLAYVGVAALGGSLLWFVLVSILMGLGFTFYSGAMEAWLVDELSHSGFTGQLDQVFARGSMISGVAMLIGTVSGGLLGSLDLAIPYLVRAALLAVVFAVAVFRMPELGFTPRALRLSDLPVEMKRVAVGSLAHGWRTRPTRLLMICAFFQWGFLTWGFYAWQPYFLQLLGRDAVWVAGLIAALIALSTIAGNALVEWFSRFCGRRSTLLISAAVVQTAAAVGVGLVDSFWTAVALFLLVTGAMGVHRPVKQAYLHQVIPSEHRASVVSFDAMMGNAGGVVGQSGLGYLARVHSIAEGYVVGGLVTILALPFLVRLRGLREHADIIIGEHAGLRGCSAQGIPRIGQVTDRPVQSG